MDAIKYLNEVERMCRTYPKCKGCPATCNNTTTCKIKPAYQCSVEEKFSIVEEWSEEHPIKTRQSEFLKIYPNASTYNGQLSICPRDIDQTIEKEKCTGNCTRCKDEYWLKPIKRI